MKCPTSGGHTHNQEVAAQWTSHLKVTSCFYLSALMIRILCSVTWLYLLTTALSAHLSLALQKWSHAPWKPSIPVRWVHDDICSSLCNVIIHSFCKLSLEIAGLSKLNTLSIPGLSTFQFLVLAVCKNGGGRPCPFYHVNNISIYLGRQRGWGGKGPWSRILCTRSSFWTRSSTFFASPTFKTLMLGAVTIR